MTKVKETSILFDCFVNWAETMFTFDDYKERKVDTKLGDSNQK
jgi:hypothetical protein